MRDMFDLEASAADPIYGELDVQAEHQHLLETLKERAEWVRSHYDAYEEARGRWGSLDWCHDALATCESVLDALAAYDPAQHPEHHAVYLVAQSRMSLLSVFGQLEIVRSYEAADAQLDELRRMVVDQK